MEIRFPPPRSRANLTATEAPMTITTCIFDAYGTLFDVNAAAREVAAEPGQEQLAALWPDLARDWRRKQLEYSWLRTIAGRFIDFWEVTQDSLDWAMDAHGLHDAALRARLLAVYKELPAYPEVPEMLRALKEAGKTVAILSNGSKAMLHAALRSAGIELQAFRDVTSEGTEAFNESVPDVPGVWYASVVGRASGPTLNPLLWAQIGRAHV